MASDEISWAAIRALGDDHEAVIDLLEPNAEHLRYDYITGLAFAQLNAGRSEAALGTLADAMERLGSDPEAAGYLLNTKALILTTTGHQDAAVAAADEACRMLPDEAFILSGRIDVDLHFRTATGGGRVAADRALELAPADPRVLNRAMRFEIVLKRRSTAMALADRLVEVRPRDPDVYALRAMVYASRFRLLRATRNAALALRIAPQRRLACESSGTVLYFWAVMSECVLILPVVAGLFVSSGRPWFIYVLTYMAALYTTTFITAIGPFARDPIRTGVMWALRQPWMRSIRWAYARCARYLVVLIIAVALGFPQARIVDICGIAIAFSPALWHLIKSPRAYIRSFRATFAWARGLD